MQRIRGLSWAAALAVGLIFSQAGCKVGGDDVEYWKRTVKGPTRLAAVLTSDRYSDELRTKAALAMIEMERSDVSGLAVLKRSLEELQREGSPSMATILNGLVEPLTSALKEDVPLDQELPATQVRAKDAAYMVIPFASEATKQSLTKAVVGWYAKDFPGRSLAGDYSAEQVTKSLGATAAMVLIDALHAEMPPQALVKIAEIVGQSGGEQAKKKGAERLVAIEKQMEGKAFLDAIQKRVVESYKAAGREPEPKEVQLASLSNRERYIVDGALSAMKYLAGEEAVATRLLAIADTKPGASDTAGWAERLNARRAKALQALEGQANATHLERLLNIALDSSNDISVRDYAFDRVGDIGSPQAIPPLWRLVQVAGCSGSGSCSESGKMAKRQRWRAGEMILGIGGKSVVKEFLSKLPSGAQYEPEELEGYATRMSQMSPPPTALVMDELRSSRWWNRVIALRFLQRRGGKAEIARVAKLKSDGASVAGEGWSKLDPAISRVGQVAAVVEKTMKERLAEATPDKAQ